MNNTPMVRQNTTALLSKTKKLMSVTKKILTKKCDSVHKDDSWMERFWEWADENNIAETNDSNEVGIVKDSIPRNKHELLQLTEPLANSIPTK